MKTIKDLEIEIIKAFEQYPDVDAKYAYLFELGKALPVLNEEHKTEANLVKGCQSKLWFYITNNDGRYALSVDGDSMVIKGIAALIVSLVEGRTKDELQHLSMDFIDKLQIWKLPSKRNNGLMAMLEHLHTQIDR